MPPPPVLSGHAIDRYHERVGVGAALPSLRRAVPVAVEAYRRASWVEHGTWPPASIHAVRVDPATGAVWLLERCRYVPGRLVAVTVVVLAVPLDLVGA